MRTILRTSPSGRQINKPTGEISKILSSHIPTKVPPITGANARHVVSSAVMMMTAAPEGGRIDGSEELVFCFDSCVDADIQSTLY